MKKFRIEPKRKAVLHCDNVSAIHVVIANNHVFHERTKHIEIDYHFIRNKDQQGIISLAYIGTASQPSDVLIKPLGEKDIIKFLGKLNVLDPYSPT